MIRGEIYLAPFTYADLRGSKRRPVCVVSSAPFHADPDVIEAERWRAHATLPGETAIESTRDISHWLHARKSAAAWLSGS